MEVRFMRQNGLETSATVVDNIERGAILGDKVEKLIDLLVFLCLLCKTMENYKFLFDQT